MKRPHNTPKVAHKAHKRQKVEKKTPRAEIPIPKRKIRLDDLGWTQVSMPDRLEDFEGFYGLEEIEDVSVVKDAVTGNLTFETSKTDEQIEQDIKQASQRDEDEAKRLEEITFGAQQKEDGDEEEEEGEGVEKMETPQKSAQVNVDDAWEGFSDDEAAPNGIVATDEATPAKNETAVASAAEPVDTTKQEKPKSKKEKAAEKAEKAKAAKKAKKAVEVAKGEEEEKLDDGDASEGEILGPSAFSILADRADDEDDEVDVSAWEELKLSEKMLDSLAKLKFHTPTTIQESCIPEIMAGRDLIGKASTGSGKTLAFGIPIIEAYLTALSVAKDPKDKAPIALIIAPTRELAHQITAHITALCAKGDYVAPKIASVTGGLAVQKQRRQLETADIVVGTPGRLWEVISSGQGLLDRVKQIRFLVVDEADRLLSHGNYKELGEILKILEIDNPVEQDDDAEAPTSFERQTLVFSATFQKSLQQKLAGKAKGGGDELLNKQQSMEYLLKKLKFREEKPKFIDANPNSQMASKLKEGLVECAGTEKDLYSTTPYPLPPKPCSTCPSAAFQYGTESTFTIYRTLQGAPWIDSSCHRRRSSWSRYSPGRPGHSLPSTPRCRHLRASLRSYRSCRPLRIQHPNLRPRRSCRCPPPNRKSAFPRGRRPQDKESRLLHPHARHRPPHRQPPQATRHHIQATRRHRHRQGEEAHRRQRHETGCRGLGSRLR
jgi:ATP-dependent RNA helicase DDX24/MAK5